MAQLVEIRAGAVFVKFLRSTLVALTLSPAVACQADDLPSKAVEFFRERDKWLLRKIIAEQPALETPAQDALHEEEAKLAAHKEKLEPIQRRIAKNKSKASMAPLVKKDEARAIEARDAIQASEQRIAKLREEAAAEEQKAIEWRRRIPEIAKAKLQKQRADLTLMPRGAGELDPAHLQVGLVGLLPQWPISLEPLDPLKREAAIRIIKRMANGGTFQGRESDLLEVLPGGLVNATKRHNLRVIQVLTDAASWCRLSVASS